MSTHQKMNSEIIGLLRISDNPTCSYAAERIEELEKENEAMMQRGKKYAEALDRINKLSWTKGIK